MVYFLCLGGALGGATVGLYQNDGYDETIIFGNLTNISLNAYRITLIFIVFTCRRIKIIIIANLFKSCARCVVFFNPIRILFHIALLYTIFKEKAIILTIISSSYGLLIQ